MGRKFSSPAAFRQALEQRLKSMAAERRMPLNTLRLKLMIERLLARLFTAFPALAERWGKNLQRDRGAIPWAAPVKPLREARLAVVTTGGVHLKSQAPFNMADKQGDPSCREIPVETPAADLAITHDYYNHRDADLDLNLVLPLDRLRELLAHQALGALHPTAFSFMGHIDGPHVQTLVEKTAPEAARRLAAGKVDYAFLVPA